MSEFKFCKDCRYFKPPSRDVQIGCGMFGVTPPLPVCVHPKLVAVDVDGLVSGEGSVYKAYSCRTNRESFGPDSCGIDAKLFEPKPTDADPGDEHGESHDAQ